MTIGRHVELTSDQAANIIGVTIPTILSYMDRGILPGRRQGPRRIARIKPDDLRVFAASYDFNFDESLLKEYLGA